MTERDIDERAAIPDEETEPEESKESIRAALWEAWTAGGAQKSRAEGGVPSRPAPRGVARSFPRKAWPPGADAWPPVFRLMAAERADPLDGLGSGGRRLDLPAKLHEIGRSVAGGESGVGDECGQSRLGLGRVRRDRLRALGTARAVARLGARWSLSGLRRDTATAISPLEVDASAQILDHQPGVVLGRGGRRHIGLFAPG